MTVLKTKEDHSGYEQHKLDPEFYNIAEHRAERDHQAWKIYFAKNARIGHKGGGCGSEACGKIIPDSDAAHVEQHRLHPFRFDAGNVIENEHKHGRGKQWLDEVPQRAEHRLLVLRSKISFYKQQQQIPIAPYFF